MSRKDFALIAEIIARLELCEPSRKDIAMSFAVELMNTNPRFNMKRFLKACEAVHVP